MAMHQQEATTPEPNQAPFPFFVGAPRSGTTLVRAIFDAHPDMAVPDESNFVPVLGRARTRYESDGALSNERFLDDLFSQKRFGRWELSRADVQEALDARRPADVPDAIRTVFALYAERRGKTRYGDKTPSYLMEMPLLARLFPEATFIQVLRDGRDVALSMLDVDFGPRTVAAAAVQWKERVTAGRRFGREVGAGRYDEVRYEELIDDPEAAVTRVCAAIDLPFAPEMLRYFEGASAITSHASWSRRHIALPPTKGLRDWRSQMSSDDVAVFEAIAGDLLRQLGYETGCATPSVPARVRARTAALSAQARSLRRAVRRSRGRQ